MRAVRLASGMLLPALLSLTVSGCAGLWRGTARTFDVAPNGLARNDDTFRRVLTTGAYGEAFSRARAVKRGAPTDAVLRALYQGQTGYYAGDYAASALAFAEADRLVDARITRSLSRGAVSLLTNDLALPYLPSRTERLFMRYYAMMAYTRAGNAQGATVEARRLGHLLQALADDLQPDERTLHAVMRDASGAVFEWAGEDNDALVAYRNAALLRGASRDAVDSLRLQATHGDSATLVVLVESGFVAHRVDRGMLIGLDAGWMGDSRSSKGARESKRKRGDVDALVQGLDGWLGALPGGGVFVDDWSDGSAASAPRALRWGNLQASDWLRLAWPALRRSALPTDDLRVAVDSAAWRLDAPVGDVSMAVAADLRRARPGMLLRMVARASAKATLAEAIEDEHEWAGMLFGMVSAGIERADTRSWQLLPGTLRAVRLRVPAGEQSPVVQVGSGISQVNVRLGSLSLQPGRVGIVDARVWRDASGMVAQIP